MNEKITLAYAADESFAYPACVSIQSVLRHTKSPVEVFFFDCGLNPDSRARIISSLKDHPHLELNFLDCPLADAWQNHAFPAASFALLSVPRLVPREEVLYLDADTLALADVAEVWKKCRSTTGRLLGAPDYLRTFQNIGLHADPKITAQNFRAFERVGARDDEEVFNAGVLFLRRSALEEMFTEEKVKALAAVEPALLHHAAQTLLNVVLKGETGRIGFDWNFQVPGEGIRSGKWKFDGTIDRAAFTPKILHYTGSEKPWLGHFGAPEFRHFHEVASEIVW